MGMGDSRYNPAGAGGALGLPDGEEGNTDYPRRIKWEEISSVISLCSL